MNDHELNHDSTIRDIEDDDDDESEEEQLDAFPQDPPPGFTDPKTYTSGEMDRLVVLLKGGSRVSGRIVTLGVSFASPHPHGLRGT